MKILYSTTSPYSAKVRMAARHLGIALEAVPTVTDDVPAELIAANPLGKIPVLLREGKPAVFDSRAIMQFFNRETKGKLYPRGRERRTQAETLEALCDGITDSLLAIVYERRMRPAEKLHQPVIDRNWAKVTRGLAVLNSQPPKGLLRPHGGHFALAALLGYLSLRFAGEWEADCGNLTRWLKRFEKVFADYQAMKPQAKA
jgi:glutathione S-transferase